MRFFLIAEVRFSKPLSGLNEEISKLLGDSEPLLRRGAPQGKEEEACRIKNWEIRGDYLRVELESGRYVRAHDGLLRLCKNLSQQLGRGHRIGLREIRVPQYQIKLPGLWKVEIPHPLEGEIRETEEGVELVLKNLLEKHLRERWIDRLLSGLREKPKEEEFKPRVVRQGAIKSSKFNQDPCHVGVKLGWIKEFPGRGQWIYLGPMAQLVWTIEELIVEEIAKPLGFQEAMFPKLIPLQVMQKMPGYLDNVPEGMFYVCPPPRDPKAFERFKDELRLTRKIPSEELKNIVKEPAYVLAPAQCEPFYEIFSGKHVRLEDLPIKMYDRSGWTYRWEGGGVEGLTRTQEFRRVEFVFLAEPSMVVKIRDQVLDKSVELADKMGLTWRVLEATPFYLREGVERKGEIVATYDLEIFLPFKKNWLEVGSYNVHMQKFTKSFKIKESKGREIWTGCCGFGTSRWACAFLAQHGFDFGNWPALVKNKIGKVSEVLR